MLAPLAVYGVPLSLMGGGQRLTMVHWHNAT